jgi:WD40 repeat protein
MVAFFDAQTGSLLSANPQHHTTAVTALGWVATHTTVPLAISAGTDTTAIVWNGQSHQPQSIFEQHTTAIEAIATFGEIVATASHGGVVRVWNALSGQEIHGFFSETQQPLRAVAFSTTGSLATGGDDARVSLWSDGLICTHQTQNTAGIQCNDASHHLLSHTRPVRAIAFSPDGTLLATGGDDRKLILWSVLHAKPLLLQLQPDAITALSWSPSGQFLAGAVGSRVLIWRIPTYK